MNAKVKNERKVMGTPSPNPKDGAPRLGGAEEETEAGHERAPPAPKSRAALLAQPALLDTRLQYVALPSVAGPSGIKQCFRTVKSARRIPTLPRVGEPAPARAPDPKRHACRACDKRFASPGKLGQHLLSHTGELPFQCERCDKRFNSRFKLARHGLIHREARAYACPHCDKSFHRKDHLSNHARVHDPGKRVHACERAGCGKRYSSALGYRKHAALHAAEEGDLTCRICSQTFRERADILHHLKVHAGSRTVKNEEDKKFVCPYCARKFFTGKDVKRHLVVHTGRRDFPCQFCPQKFGRKDHLVRHVKNAHPEERWQSSGASTSTAPPPLAPLPGPALETAPASIPTLKQETVECIRTKNVTYINITTFDPNVQSYERLLQGGGLSVARTEPPPLVRLPEQTTIVKVEPSDAGEREGAAPPPLFKREPESPEPSTSREMASPRGRLPEDVKYEFDPELLYVMPPPPPYLPGPSGAVGYLDPVENLSVEMETGELGLVDESEVESILIQEGSTSEDLALPNENIMELLDSGAMLSPDRQTVLPTFHQAFQTSQSPKPQPPSK